jgi:hypothetical protein
LKAKRKEGGCNMARKRGSGKTTEEGKGIMKKNISFADCGDTLEEIFGTDPISRADVVSIISAYIRDYNLVIQD